jgi:TonB family protein
MLVQERCGRSLARWASLLWPTVLVSCIFVAMALAQDTDSSRKVVAKTTPAIPELAKKMHLSGKVKVEVVVSAAGAVTSAKLVGGNPVFEANAIDAVKHWKFESGAGQTKAVIIVEFADQ